MTKFFNSGNTEGAPVVALHSSASGKFQWTKLIDQLLDRHEVFAFDLPGYGNSPGRNADVVGMSAVADPIIEKIEALKMPIHLVGHSFGGATALKIGLMRPDLVKSLTLFEPAAFHVLESGNRLDRQLFEDFLGIEQNLNAQMLHNRNDLGMEKFIDFWNGETAWVSLPESQKRKLASLASTVSSDFECSLSENWALEDIADLSIPTLMLMGMDSPGIAQRTASLIAEHIPDAELAMLPGLGHMAPVQDPEWVNPRIHQHIARIEKSAAHVSWPHRAAA